MSDKRHTFRGWWEFFQAMGFGPWDCMFCYKPVAVGPAFRDPLEPVVHHKDHDHYNDEPSNWAIVHRACHQQHHHRGKKVSHATRRRMSLAQQGRKTSAETRAKISVATKAAMADPLLRKHLSEAKLKSDPGGFKSGFDPRRDKRWRP